MSDERIIVLVSDRGDSKHGEISVLDDPVKAERLVETLLEAGFEKDRIRVFSGRTSEFEVSHRPVVALVAEGEESEAQPAIEVQRGEPAVEAQAQPAEVQAAAAEAKSASAEAVASAKQEDAPMETNEEKEDPDSSEATPVRFSSLFRSA